jgi:hypothetical protein
MSKTSPSISHISSATGRTTVHLATPETGTLELTWGWAVCDGVRILTYHWNGRGPTPLAGLLRFVSEWLDVMRTRAVLPPVETPTFFSDMCELADAIAVTVANRVGYRALSTAEFCVLHPSRLGG